ncbi:hypothetical protein GCM10009096_10530 [Parasphingorhabdus litoris]|uniref:Helix-turn-helix domain-containing protein n=1 Tax=Parasphingorhabdus litoris TaxID=394733 RepID=A0ABN1AA67_9SPHN|nr:helix-turn-helix domain-containing protein [Parasphingorhabdus litoris]
MLNQDLLDGAQEAADYIGVHPRSVYNMANSGRLPVIRMGRRLFFRKSEIDAAFQSETSSGLGDVQTA